MDPLILEAAEPTLRRGIIPAVSLAAHGALHAVFPQKILEHPGGILAATVRMMNKAGSRLSTEPGHAEGIGHQINRHTGLNRPAHHFPIEQIQYDGQVEPACSGRQIGDVGGPHLVWRGRLKLPIQKIRRHGQPVTRFRRRLITTLMPGTDTVLPHHAFYSALADGKATVPQLPDHPRAAVSALVSGMDRSNQRDQLGLRPSLPARGAPALPGTIAAEADHQGTTQFTHPINPFMRFNPGVRHSASLAKPGLSNVEGYAAAFFKISSALWVRINSAFKREISILSALLR